jgi:hypothetical protein
MREFFRGWKRKVGCVTLVLAGLFAIGWVRSLTIEDNFSFLAFEHFECFKSRRAAISRVSWEKSPKSTLRVYPISFHSNEINAAESFDLVPMPFGAGAHLGMQRAHMSIRYRSIVIPLTAISAWLLLAKSRTRIKPPATPVSENA